MHLYAPSESSLENPVAAVLDDPSLAARSLTLAPKSVLYEPDEQATNLYFIRKGQVRTYQVAPNGSRRLIEILGTGAWCGAAALGPEALYGEIAEAATITSISIVPVDRLNIRLSHEPSVAIELIRQLAGKLTAFREDAGGLVFEDCNHRLIRTLLQLSESPAASRCGEGVVVHITHEQLAQKVGVARETVSLALGELRRKNLLRTGRNQLVFRPSMLMSDQTLQKG